MGIVPAAPSAESHLLSQCANRVVNMLKYKEFISKDFEINVIKTIPSTATSRKSVKPLAVGDLSRLIQIFFVQKILHFYY